MNRWTLMELSGKFELFVVPDGTEGLPETCRHAADELGMRGLLPPAIAITELTASREPVDDSGTVRCSVSWMAGVEGT